MKRSSWPRASSCPAVLGPHLEGAEAGGHQALEVPLVGDGPREAHRPEARVVREVLGKLVGGHRVAEDEAAVGAENTEGLAEGAVEVVGFEDVEEAVLRGDPDGAVLDRDVEGVALADLYELLAQPGLQKRPLKAVREARRDDLPRTSG